MVFLLKVYLSDCEGGKDLSSVDLIIMLVVIVVYCLVIREIKIRQKRYPQRATILSIKLN